jgi:hypothetical protein
LGNTPFSEGGSENDAKTQKDRSPSSPPKWLQYFLNRSKRENIDGQKAPSSPEHLLWKFLRTILFRLQGDA